MKTKYSKDQDILFALVSYLSTAEARSRTIKGLSESLSFKEHEIRSAINKYRGLFIQVPYNGAGKKDPYFTLHLRYGLRRGNDNEDREPLSPEYTKTLLTIIGDRAYQEKFLRSQSYKIWSAFAISIIAIVFSIYTALSDGKNSNTKSPPQTEATSE